MSLTYVPVIPADRDITFGGDITFSGTVTTDSTVTVGTDLTVDGDTTLTTLGVTGAVALSDTLEVTGHTSMSTGQTSGTFTIFTGAAAGLDLGTAGGGIAITEGANCRMGEATLTAGAVTVSNASITANTRIFVSRAATGGTEGTLSTTQTAGTDFTITSSSGTDTSTINWLLMEPS